MDYVGVYIVNVARRPRVRLMIALLFVVYFVWNYEQARRNRAAVHRDSINGFIEEQRLGVFMAQAGRKPRADDENPAAPSVAKKYLVVKCDEDYENLVDCQDWSLMLKSVYSGFWLARLVGREFSISINAPCDVEQFYRPGKIKWNEVPALDSDSISTKLVYQIDDDRLPLRLTTMSSTQVRELEDSEQQVLVFLANRNYGDKLARSTDPELKRRVQALVERENKNLTIQDGFPSLFDELFELQDSMREKHDLMVTKLAARPRAKLVCMQLNLRPTDKSQNVRRSVETRDVDLDLMKRVWNFTRHHLIGNLSNFVDDNDGYTLFLSTDHERVVHETMHEFVNQTILVNNWGVEMSGVNGRRFAGATADEKCQSFERTLLDFHAFAHCDMAVVPHDELSQLGLYRMPRSKKDELVLFRYSEKGDFERVAHVDHLLTY